MPKKYVPVLKINKSLLWLKHFLDNSNKSTFLHRTNSAILAGYGKGSSAQTMGERNYKKYANEIGKWIDDNGLSENALKQKLLSLLDAHETKFFADKGVIVSQVDVEALGIQQRALDMAFKVKGVYAPDKTELTGKNGGKIEVEHDISAELGEVQDWLKSIRKK